MPNQQVVAPRYLRALTGSNSQPTSGQGDRMTRTLGTAFLLIGLAMALPTVAANPYVTIPGPVDDLLGGLELPASIDESKDSVCLQIGRVCVIEITCESYDPETGGPPVKRTREGIGIMVGDPQTTFGPYGGFAVLC